MLDGYRATKWVITRLLADATLTTLLGANRVYRDKVIQGASVATVPAVVVARQDMTPPWRPLKVGADTQAKTKVKIRTTAIIQGNSYALLKPVADRLIVLLDGVINQEPSDAHIFSSVKAEDDERDITEPDLAGVTFKAIDIYWDVEVKATA